MKINGRSAFVLSRLLVTSSLLLVTKIANAQIVSAPTNVLTSPGAIANLFCGALNWMFWLLIVLSIAMALAAAYIYATSNGDPDKVSKAGKTLLYVAIAVAVALIAEGVPYIVSSFIGGGLNSGVCGGGGSTLPANSPLY